MKDSFFGRKSMFGVTHAMVILIVACFCLPALVLTTRNAIHRTESKFMADFGSPTSPGQTGAQTTPLDEALADKHSVVAHWPSCSMDDPRLRVLITKLQAEMALDAEPTSSGRLLDSSLLDSTSTQLRDSFASSDSGLPRNQLRAGVDESTGSIQMRLSDENASIAAVPSLSGVSDQARRIFPNRDRSRHYDGRQDHLDSDTRQERIRAQAVGAELGLRIVDQTFLNWAGQNEKWLMGSNGQSYYINPRGELYRWNETPTWYSYLKRNGLRMVGLFRLQGQFVTAFESSVALQGETPNDFYSHPLWLCAPLFDSLSVHSWPDSSSLSAEATKKASSNSSQISGIVTVLKLTDVGCRDLQSVLGRGVLGKPAGRFMTLAAESGFQVDLLKRSPLAGIPLGWINPSRVSSQMQLMGATSELVNTQESNAIAMARLMCYALPLGLVIAYIFLRSFRVAMIVVSAGMLSLLCGFSMMQWSGEAAEAQLLTIPTLFYVIGFSSAVQFVNYFQNALREGNESTAADRALQDAFVPTSLSALTLVLGFVVLHAIQPQHLTTNGVFTCLGILATVGVLFPFLPSALVSFCSPKWTRHLQSNLSAVGIWAILGSCIVRYRLLMNAFCCVVFVGIAVTVWPIQDWMSVGTQIDAAVDQKSASGSLLGAALVLGLTTEGIIHFVVWFRQGRSRGLDRKQSSAQAFQYATRASCMAFVLAFIAAGIWAASLTDTYSRFAHSFLALAPMAMLSLVLFLPALSATNLGCILELGRMRIATTSQPEAIPMDEIENREISVPESASNPPRQRGRYDKSHSPVADPRSPVAKKRGRFAFRSRHD